MPAHATPPTWRPMIAVIVATGKKTAMGMCGTEGHVGNRYGQRRRLDRIVRWASARCEWSGGMSVGYHVNDTNRTSTRSALRIAQKLIH